MVRIRKDGKREADAADAGRTFSRLVPRSTRCAEAVLQACQGFASKDGKAERAAAANRYGASGENVA